MQTVRVWLLLVLVVLLPVRGAMAAAMLCAPGGTGMQSELPVHPPGHAAMDDAMTHAHAAHAHGDLHDDHAGGDHHDHGHGHAASDQCNLCSAFCSITPLPSDVPGLPAPLALPSVKFPDVSSPAPTFLSDGQERPPRSI